MPQVPKPSRKMLDHTIPVWAESDAACYITICCCDRGKNTLAVPDVAKIVFDAIQAYEQRKLWFVRFVLLMPDHLHGIFDFPLEACMQTLFASWKRFLSRKHSIRFQRDFFDHRLRKTPARCPPRSVLSITTKKFGPGLSNPRKKSVPASRIDCEFTPIQLRYTFCECVASGFLDA
jgi:putative transposase